MVPVCDGSVQLVGCSILARRTRRTMYEDVCAQVDASGYRWLRVVIRPYCPYTTTSSASTDLRVSIGRSSNFLWQREGSKCGSGCILCMDLSHGELKTCSRRELVWCEQLTYCDMVPGKHRRHSNGVAGDLRRLVVLATENVPSWAPLCSIWEEERHIPLVEASALRRRSSLRNSGK